MIVKVRGTWASWFPIQSWGFWGWNSRGPFGNSSLYPLNSLYTHILSMLTCPSLWLSLGLVWALYLNSPENKVVFHLLTATPLHFWVSCKSWGFRRRLIGKTLGAQHYNLSSDLQLCWQKLGVVTQSAIPVLGGGVETRGSWDALAATLSVWLNWWV